MRYSQTRKSSEELLRLIIKKMASAHAAFTPYTYTVWYEYLADINPGLSLEMNKLLNSSKPLDDDVIKSLYETHISESRYRIANMLSEDVKHLLSKLLDNVEETGKQTQSFGNELQAYSNQLRAEPDMATLTELVKNMASDTAVMNSSITNLHSKLECSKEEVGRLQKELEAARQEALIDPLTGVNNRRGFEILAQNVLANNAPVNKGLCLIMVDIDHFKKINDSYGHVFGDIVIRSLANTLKAKIRGQDSVARLGGEEFAVLLPDTSLGGAQVVAEQIRTSIENGRIRRTNSEALTGAVTVSIGIAAYHEGDTLTNWMDQADKALYASKTGGRNRVTVYSG